MKFQKIYQSLSTEGREIPLLELLDSREQRAELQQKLREQYGQTLLSVTQLAVGGVKKNALLDWIFANCLQHLTACFAEMAITPTAQIIRQFDTGNEAIFVLPVDANWLKQQMIALEDSSPLARLWDLDVITAEGNVLSRQQFGLNARQCLICNENAKICAKTRRHSLEQITAEMQRRVTNAQFADNIGELAYQALQDEAELTPKPSLVDSQNSGSHRDMDLATFQKSAKALRPFFSQFITQGMATSHLAESQILALIRPLGIKAEQAMLDATNGINTHKGAIFAFGLACTAIGRLKAQGEKFQSPFALVQAIGNTVSLIATGICNELSNFPLTQPATAGIKLFQQYGLTGARGEAEQGFPLVMESFAQFISPEMASLDWQHRCLVLLLTLIAKNQDTNVVHRGGLAGLAFMQQQAKDLLSSPHIKNKAWLINQLQHFDQACIEKNLSAGGSADLLALTLFFYSLTL